MSRNLFEFARAITLAVVLLFVAGPVSVASANDHDVPAVHDGEDDAIHSEDAGAHSESGHGGGGSLLTADPGASIWNLLIFLSVFAILAKFVWPQILSGLKAREDHIREDLEGADRANKEAKLLLTQYNQRLSAAQAEVQSLLAQARKDAEASGQRIVEESRREAEAQKVRALNDIEAAKRAALAEMADQTTAVATQMARQMIGRELRAEDHAEVIRQALQGLPSKN